MSGPEAIRKAGLRNRCLALCLLGLGSLAGGASFAATLIPSPEPVTVANAVAAYRNLP